MAEREAQACFLISQVMTIQKLCDDFMKQERIPEGYTLQDIANVQAILNRIGKRIGE